MLLSLMIQGNVIHLLFVNVFHSGNLRSTKENRGVCVWTCFCASEQCAHLNSLQISVEDLEMVIQELQPADSCAFRKT